MIRPDQRVVLFNTAADKAPIPIEEKDKFWEQMILQTKLVREEAIEQHDAALAHNLKEVLDGACDVHVTQDYMDHLITSAGIDLDGAFDEVCLNNSRKVTTSKEFAQKSADFRTEQGNPCYVCSSQYENEEYFVIKQVEDGKIQKLLDHKKPELDKYIPEHVLEALEG